MKPKKLNSQQQESLKNLIIQGKLPSELKDIFGISISTIHNFKKEMKEHGINIPDARGKRPSNGFSKKEKEYIKLMEIFIEKNLQEDYFLKISIGENYYEMNITGLLKIK